MAQKVTTLVEITDDLDGGKADRTVTFTFDGTSYEIDLSRKNANAFDKAFALYVGNARKVRNPSRTNGARTAGKRTAGKRSDLAEIRAWARSNGYEISDRGRIPAAVVAAYDGN